MDVEENPRVVGPVERGAPDASWSSRARARDLEVEALRIELCSIGLTPAVQSNDLVTEHVVTCSDIGRDFDRPSKARVNELVRSPVAVIALGVAGLHQACITNLEELKAVLVDILTGTIAVREVIHDRPLMRLRPCVPLQEDGVTSRQLDVRLGRLCVSVADDVGASCGDRLNEAVVSLLDRPAKHVRRVL